MIVRADCNQLSNKDLYLNIANLDYEHLGVWTNYHKKIAVLYKEDQELWFMTFNNLKAREEFEKKHITLKTIWWDNKL